MRDLQRLGLGADALGALPALSHQARTALHCWGFCDGWVPERWPVYAALYPVGDWAAVVDLMQAIRAVQRRAQESASGHSRTVD